MSPVDDSAHVRTAVLEIRGCDEELRRPRWRSTVRSIALHAGEVHALLGENGAGKSTLIKIMTGVHTADRGEILIDGERGRTSKSPAEAQRARQSWRSTGAALIFPDLSVAENIFIGHRNRGQIVRLAADDDEADAMLASLDVDLDAAAPASTLTVGRAADRRDRQGDVPRRARADHGRADGGAVGARGRAAVPIRSTSCAPAGVAMLFITHRLDEVFEIADRVTVFRDGRHISTTSGGRDDAGDRSSARWSGASSATSSCARATSPATSRLRVEGLGRAGRLRGRLLRGPRRRGRGLRRSGRRGTHRGRPRPVRHRPRRARARSSSTARASHDPQPRATRCGIGIAYLSEDRRQLGLVMPQSIAANISLPALRSYRTPLRPARSRGRARGRRAFPRPPAASARRRSTRRSPTSRAATSRR